MEGPGAAQSPSGPRSSASASAESMPTPSSAAVVAIAEAGLAPLPPSRPVKRPRPVKSCYECRARKLKCDRLQQCSQCLKGRRECRYSAEHEAGGNMSDDGSGVEDSVAERPPKRPARSSALTLHPPLADRYCAGDDDGGGGSGAGSTACVSSPAELGDVVTRLGRLEKLVIEQALPRTGLSPSSQSQSQPHRRAALVHPHPRTVRGLSIKGETRTRYFGQNSVKVLLKLFEEASIFMSNMGRTEDVRMLFLSLRNAHGSLQSEHRRKLEPMTVFVDSMTPVLKRMADILPGKATCDRLVDLHLTNPEMIYRIIHVPTFRREYEDYWAGKGCQDAFLPRLLCMLSNGSRHGTEGRGLSHDRSAGVHVPTACALVREWLDSLKGKQLVDSTTLQTELLLLHSQRTIYPRDQDLWVQLGYIVRMAMTMGLHRDPSEFSHLSVFMSEYRRRLWYTVVDMDFHVALVCAMPPAVRDGEYTCRAPRNLNDDALSPSMVELPESKPLDQAATSQLHTFVASTLPSRLRAANVLARLDTVRDYDEILDVGCKLEAILDDANCLFPGHTGLDPQSRQEQYRIHLQLGMHIRRPLLSLYRPFALGSPDCPAHISLSYLKSSIAILTYMDELDARPGGNQEDMASMYSLVMRNDIMQAAFSVCYYIKNAADNTAAGPRPSGAAAAAAHWSPALAEREISTSQPLDGRFPWSTPNMVGIVQRNIDRLTGFVSDSSSDLRDIVALSIVLNSVQAGSPEQKTERIKAGIKRILDACLQAVNGRSETIPPTRPSAPKMPVCAPAPENIAQSSTFTLGLGASIPVTPAPAEFWPTEFTDNVPVWADFLAYWKYIDMSDQWA